MPHSQTTVKSSLRRNQKELKSRSAKADLRYTVGLSAGVATEVERYAETLGTSMSKAIAALVRLGLEGQQSRKRDFFKKLKENLADDDVDQQDRLVDEFRALILGR